jgi:V8-like Glu-specific endopeptidase
MKRSLLTAMGLVAATAVPDASADPAKSRPVPVAVTVAPRVATAAESGPRAANLVVPRQSAARRPDRKQLADGLARAARRDPGASIVGGEPHSGNPEVALIIATGAGPDDGLICSATLIGPKLLLTAAHCVDEFEFPVERFDIYFGTDATINDDPGFVFATTAASAVYHPMWNREDLESGNDIAVMHLVDEVPLEPRPLNTTPLGEADVGAPLHLVGWGVTAPASEDSGIKRHVISQVESVQEQLVQVGNAETSVCSGDSGGPAFLEIDGVEHVAGVASFADTDCVMHGFSTRVDVFVDFISENSEPGGGGGGGGGGGFGDPCVTGDECESGVCVTNEDGSDGVCTELCDETTACPDGTECVQLDEESAVCLPPEEGGGGGELGDACAAGGDCASGLCAVTPEGDGTCTVECTGALDCEAGFSCQEIEDGAVCLPAADPGQGGGFPTPIPSDDQGGCAAAGGPGGLMGLLLALAALLLVRPAQRRSPPRPAPRSLPE